MNQKKKLTLDFTKYVDEMYKYAYRYCKQKHKILMDFNTDEDFVTKSKEFDKEKVFPNPNVL